MNRNAPNASNPELPLDHGRKPWIAPVIEDADIGVVTHGGGTSGMEGTNYLKPGS